MEIEYYGGVSFGVATKKVQVVVNPRTSDGSIIAVKGAVELATSSDYVNPATARTFEGPGEYEIGDVSIVGIAAEPKPLIGEVSPTYYRIEAGDIRVAVLSDCSKKLTETQLERLGVVDIAVLTVQEGGASMAAIVAKQLEPRVVVPLGRADAVATELGKTVEIVDKLKLKNSSSLPGALSVFRLQEK